MASGAMQRIGGHAPEERRGEDGFVLGEFPGKLNSISPEETTLQVPVRSITTPFVPQERVTQPDFSRSGGKIAVAYTQIFAVKSGQRPSSLPSPGQRPGNVGHRH